LNPFYLIVGIINSQVSFMLFIVIYLSDEFVGFYYLSTVKLHLLITRLSLRVGSYSLIDMGSLPSSCRVAPTDHIDVHVGLTLSEVIET
jgi:hypothetical protein